MGLPASADGASAKITALLDAVPDPSAPSTTKFRPVAEYLAGLVDLDTEDVYPVYVSKPGNLRVRFAQSGRDETAILGVAILEHADDLERSLTAAGTLLGRGNMEAIAFFTRDAEGWGMPRVLQIPDSDLGAALELHFPTTRVEAAPTAGSDRLKALIDLWRADEGYPRDLDIAQRASRENLAAMLEDDRLAQAISEPESFDIDTFRRITSNTYGSAGNQGQMNSYLKDGLEAIPALAAALRHLLYGSGSDAERIDDVTASEEWHVKGLGEAIATKCLAIVYPQQWLPLFVYRGENGKRAVMRLPELPVESPPEAGKSSGQLAVESNDALLSLLSPYFEEDTWGAMVFLWWLLKRQKKEQLVEPVSDDVASVAEELLLDADWLRTVIELLQDKKQLIFYGPPGTGKTYVARRLAQLLAPDERTRKTLQFHPSYSYEDFVEGYRPVMTDKGLTYELRDGPFKTLAEVASSSPEPCVLLIDEVNRGNLSKIFGELYYLLEYRGDGDQIDLQYGSGAFEMPENLYIIGTMNTADRSIAILDAALRRRFHFVEFFPDRKPVRGLLRRWLELNAPKMVYVADLIDQANAMLPDRHLAIGPSHFMRPGLDRTWLERIWTYSILPYIEEQFFDEPDRVAEFELERLEKAAPTTGEGESGGGEPGDQAAPAEGVGAEGG